MSRRRMRPSYSRLTPLASTSTGPSRSRVRKVDAMPRRPLSRNSTIVACVPTATISVGARFVREQQRGVLAHALGDELVVLDARRERAARGPAPRPSGCTWWMSCAPQCIARSDSESKSPMMMSGFSFDRRAARRRRRRPR